MATHESVRIPFEQLRRFLFTDLARIVDQDVGGNYAATTLIAVGCEILGRLKYGGKGAEAGRRFFAKELAGTRLPKGVSDTLFDALREGLVHWYDTAAILVGGRSVTVAVSWRERPHLHVDSETATLYVNVRDLFRDFAEAAERYAQLLREDVGARREFLKAWEKDRRITAPTRDRAAWLGLLGRDGR